jgi:hypothetical protein
MPKNEELVDFLEGVELLEEDQEETPELELEDEDLEEDEDLVDEDLEEEEEDESEEESPEDESEEDETDDEDAPLVDIIKNSLGFEYDEEFEDTEEGIQLLVERSAEKLADNKLNDIFSEYPDVQELFEYRRLGGDPEKFMETKFPEVDFSKVEFDADDEAQQEMLVKSELKLNGYTGNELEAELEDIKNGGILENKAKRALSRLKAKQEEEQNSLLEQQQQAYEQQQQEIEEYWQEVENKIDTSTSFKGLKIPSKDKKDFFSYISKVTEKGVSQRDLDLKKMDNETKLAIDYLLFKGFDLTEIVDRKAKSKNAKTLRERMAKKKLEKQKEDRQPGTFEELGTI